MPKLRCFVQNGSAQHVEMMSFNVKLEAVPPLCCGSSPGGSVVTIRPCPWNSPKLPHLEAPPPCQGCFPCDSSHGLALLCQLSCPLLLLSLSLCHLQGKMLGLRQGHWSLQRAQKLYWQSMQPQALQPVVHSINSDKTDGAAFTHE